MLRTSDPGDPQEWSASGSMGRQWNVQLRLLKEQGGRSPILVSLTAQKLAKSHGKGHSTGSIEQVQMAHQMGYTGSEQCGK